MAKIKIPDVVYVQIEGGRNAEEYLQVYASLDDCGEGEVVTFKKTQKLHKRFTTEIRREGTKTWFKP